MPAVPPSPRPAPLRAREEGAFTRYSVVTRLPDIARRTIEENAFDAATTARMETLIREIPMARIRPLQSVAAPDAAAWRQYVAPYTDQTWLDVPWFFAETYFYRRILEAVEYFQMDGEHGPDPFAYQKRQGLRSARAGIQQLSEFLHAALQPGADMDDALTQSLAFSLWGNQADLSLWPAADDEGAGKDETTPAPARDAAQQQAHLLADDRPAALAHLHRYPAPRVDFILDNAGFELVGDLCLVDLLLSGGRVAEVHLHAKIHPTFVSDALIQDVRTTVDSLAGSDVDAVRQVGERLQAHLAAGRLFLHDHPFWTSPLAMWEMPDDLRAQLAPAALLVSKGDANYRRLLGDRHWPFTTPFVEIVNYTPAPLVALRTLKSEVAAGLRPQQLEELEQTDPDWLINGQWGVIQFAKP